jgi:hypothetical protein
MVGVIVPDFVPYPQHLHAFHLMGVARQASASAAGRLVLQLKAPRQDERQHQFNKCLPIAEQLKVRCFISKIDSDSPVFAGLASGVAHGHPQVRWSMQLVTKDEGNASQFQEDRDGVGALPRNPMESGKNGAA